MTNLNPNQVLESSLDWRYAVKKYDSSRKISEADWKTLSQAILKAPSSYGLSPWKAFVVKNPDLRAKLRFEAGHSQSQITDASHFVVFATRDSLTSNDVEAYLSRIADVRHIPRESLKGFEDLLTTRLVKGIPAEDVLHWTQRQAYLALGFLVEAAAILKIDATPMEGIQPALIDKILGLEGSGYKSVVAAALGYRHEEDANQNLPKVRFAQEDVIKEV